MAEVINVSPEIPQEDPNHAQAMIDKADGKADGETSQQSDGERLLAGKYKSEEELSKGILELLKARNEGKDLEAIYKELESGLGKQPSPDEEPQDAPKESSDQEQVEAALEKAGLNFEEFSQEFQENGELSEESYEKLQKAGLPKEIVDTYIEGMKALAQQQFQEIYSITGGEEGYKAMIEWAASNLSENEKEAFNRAVMGDLTQAKFAVEALHVRYTKSNGEPPKGLVQGQPPSTRDSVGVYRSLEEMKRDMADPRYHSDPAFRADVHKKLERSNIL